MPSFPQIVKNSGKYYYIDDDGNAFDITTIIDNEIKLRLEVEKNLQKYSSDLNSMETNVRMANMATQLLYAKKELKNLVESGRRLFNAFIRNERIQESLYIFETKLSSAEKWLANSKNKI